MHLKSYHQAQMISNNSEYNKCINDCNKPMFGYLHKIKFRQTVVQTVRNENN